MKYFLKTYGCQSNLYDSYRLEDVMQKSGYKVTQEMQQADVIIFNTCHIREKATEKLYSDLGRANLIKQEHQKMGKLSKIAVLGCVAQAESDLIIKRAKYVDIVLGTQNLFNLPLSLNSNEKVVDVAFPATDKFDTVAAASLQTSNIRYISIQEGCDKFCTFCVVPYTRGAEYSRPVEAILAEVREAASAKETEIWLTGQNVNAYHGVNAQGKECDLAYLISKVAEIKNVAFIKYTSSHPNNMQDNLIAAHGEIPQLAKYLHLAVQSGSDKILKRMNRHHTSDQFLRIIDKFRKVLPDMAFSSDFIVGFPEESDKDFADTLKLIRQVGFASSYSFKYSPRPGTPAAVMREQIPERLKEERLRILQDVLNEHHYSYNQRTVGKIMPVLFSWKENSLVGKNSHNQSVFCTQSDMYNTIQEGVYDMKITQAQSHCIKGELLNDRQINYERITRLEGVN